MPACACMHLSIPTLRLPATHSRASIGSRSAWDGRQGRSRHMGGISKPLAWWVSIGSGSSNTPSTSNTTLQDSQALGIPTRSFLRGKRDTKSRLPASRFNCDGRRQRDPRPLQSTQLDTRGQRGQRTGNVPRRMRHSPNLKTLRRSMRGGRVSFAVIRTRATHSTMNLCSISPLSSRRMTLSSDELLEALRVSGVTLIVEENPTRIRVIGDPQAHLLRELYRNRNEVLRILERTPCSRCAKGASRRIAAYWGGDLCPVCCAEVNVENDASDSWPQVPSTEGSG